jgi:DNA-directed RNA polymerase sigma subunit (sigma70/sigma32)
MARKQYDYIKANPSLYESRLQRNKEWRAKQKIKRDKLKAAQVKETFLSKISSWDDVVDFLEPNEARVLILLYGLEEEMDKPRSMQDVAEIMNISKQGVHYLRNKAFKKIFTCLHRLHPRIH